ncbi:MAG: hypothetical protein K9J06_00430 [Flavobacteriales bacterium]|nr:hypothetical protein [Flavobacteriales bacterium]
MRYPILLLMLACSFAVKAVEFSSISRQQPVTLVQQAEFGAYMDISLKLNAEQASTKTLYLRLRFIIGNDTLHDNLTVTGAYDGVVKQLLMREGERITAQILLNNAEVEEVGGLEGSFRAVHNSTLRVGPDLGQSSFIGNVWLREQNPLFRVKFEDAGPRDVQIIFHLEGNYEYDVLHFKVKVISPEQGILFLSRTATVTDDAELQQRSRTLRLTLEGVNFSYPGSYYLQVMHTMLPDRVNGVQKVEYAVVQQ